jgi:hypothetical protein
MTRQVTLTLTVPLCPTANELATALGIATAQLGAAGDFASAQIAAQLGALVQVAMSYQAPLPVISVAPSKPTAHGQHWPPSAKLCDLETVPQPIVSTYMRAVRAWVVSILR